MKIAKKTFLAGLAVLPATIAMAWDLNLGKDKKIEFHGFASQGFLASTDYNYLGDNTTDGSFQFNEVGLNASFSPFNRTRITAQGFMFDLGDVNNNRPFLDYASIEYTFSDAVGVRAGRIRRPGGIYNHIQDVDLARTSVLLPQGVYDPRWRDFSTSIDGAVVFGSVPIGKAGDLAYEAYAGYMTLSDKAVWRGTSRIHFPLWLVPTKESTTASSRERSYGGTRRWMVFGRACPSAKFWISPIRLVSMRRLQSPVSRPVARTSLSIRHRWNTCGSPGRFRRSITITPSCRIPPGRILSSAAYPTTGPRPTPGMSGPATG
jgi:hypothetical protein